MKLSNLSFWIINRESWNMIWVELWTYVFDILALHTLRGSFLRSTDRWCYYMCHYLDSGIQKHSSFRKSWVHKLLKIKKRILIHNGTTSIWNFFSNTLEYEIVSFVYKINMHNFTRPRTHAFDNKVPRTSPIHRWRTCRTRLSFCSRPLRSNSDKFRCSLLRTSHLHSLF